MVIRRFLRSLAESDEDRLAQEIRSWSAGVAGSVRITDAPPRAQAKLAGVVRRITYRPVSGHESLEVLLTDGTGEMVVLWMGRRSIPGLTLGTRVIVEGMVGEERGVRRLVNPSFEFGA